MKAGPAVATMRRPQIVAPPAKGERIVLLGNGLAERDVYYHRIETELALRCNTHRIAGHAAWLEKVAADEHGRVRLEAIVAASWLPDVPAAKKVVAIGSSQPLDIWSKAVAKSTR